MVLDWRLAGTHADVHAFATERLAETYSALPASVPAIRQALTGFARAAGASPETLAALALAVTEAATNAVVHGYLDAPEGGAIAVEALCDEDGLLVVVGDEGRGLRPRPDSPGLGLGLSVIATASDDLEVCAGAGGGTEVRMRFRLEPG